MKKIIAVILLALMTISFSSCSKKDIQENNGGNSSVSEETTTSSKVTEAVTESESSEKAETTAHEISVHKVIVFEDFYNADGVRETLTQTRYNDDGTIKECETWNDAGEQLSFVKYTYDDNKNLLLEEHTQVPSFGKNYVCRYKYDNENRLIEKYSDMASSPDTSYYSYNPDGTLRDWKFRTDTFLVTIVCKYDDNKNCIRETYILDGDSYNIYDYKYNSDNQLVKKYESDGKVTTCITTYEYENGNLIKESSVDHKGNKIGYIYDIVYEYDADGNKTFMKSYDNNGNLACYYQYTYGDIEY